MAIGAPSRLTSLLQQAESLLSLRQKPRPDQHANNRPQCYPRNGIENAISDQCTDQTNDAGQGNDRGNAERAAKFRATHRIASAGDSDTSPLSSSFKRVSVEPRFA